METNCPNIRFNHWTPQIRAKYKITYNVYRNWEFGEGVEWSGWKVLQKRRLCITLKMLLTQITGAHKLAIVKALWLSASTHHGIQKQLSTNTQQ